MPSQKLTVRNRGALLDRMFAEPQLVTRVQALAPEHLARAIQHVGLEDAGELISMATAQQLSAVFDQDLWVSETPGQDEAFDVSRFALWLAVLLEGGVERATRKLLEIDEEFLIMALAQHVLVINLEVLALSMSRDGRSDYEDQLEKQLESRPFLELESYRVISLNEQSWDSIELVLREMNEQYFDQLDRILERLDKLVETHIGEHHGLSEVLSEAETLMADVAGARSERREQQGYVTPSSARAFLRLCLEESEQALLSAREPDAITRAHLRATAQAPAPLPAGRDDWLLSLLDGLEGEQTPRAPARKRLVASTRQPGEKLRMLMTQLQDAQDPLYDKLALELAYLANVLLSGHKMAGRRMRPAESLESALQVCELGAQRAAKEKGRSQAGLERALRSYGLVKLFQVGFAHWRAKHGAHTRP